MSADGGGDDVFVDAEDPASTHEECGGRGPQAGGDLAAVVADVSISEDEAEERESIRGEEGVQATSMSNDDGQVVEDTRSGSVVIEMVDYGEKEKEEIDLGEEKSPATASAEGEWSESTAAECRICFEGEREDDPLVCPCACRGTVRYSHASCLRRWAIESGKTTCELCKTNILESPDKESVDKVFTPEVMEKIHESVSRRASSHASDALALAPNGARSPLHMVTIEWRCLRFVNCVLLCCIGVVLTLGLGAWLTYEMVSGGNSHHNTSHSASGGGANACGDVWGCSIPSNVFKDRYTFSRGDCSMAGAVEGDPCGVWYDFIVNDGCKSIGSECRLVFYPTKSGRASGGFCAYQNQILFDTTSTGSEDKLDESNLNPNESSLVCMPPFGSGSMAEAGTSFLPEMETSGTCTCGG